ncbi:hypothetical protein P3X46_011108 [Hevea brasiliensis]|uniref:OCEL domain-containing protein n=1 Tax=Hevea brasiliensis TaxID=3981 RepID=A0ABQ9MIU6_HEVBR|nr:uncharacterized protein LOC110647005 [Hevea brasiliensis]KAJ9179300.1 hypothetical protein P3X46_011108 [Hevea brasiliensis]
MYGGSSKLGGRGGGRGGGAVGTKRLSSFPPPPPHRPSTATNHRLSIGGNSNHRNRSGPSASMSATTAAVEETFSLIPGNNPPAFSMIIRLAPDLVDEIRRAEAQGGTARIKFDSMGSNTNGNVIDVGGKEFRFTWSREFGDLCDIYEERQSGEDGNGLLVESGCAWRKVNVQRILDESTTNHVKMRSEEADRKHKSRKAIVLDHGNPSMKSQIKQLAAAESNPWRMPFKKKEPPFKKRKVESVVPKSTFKPGVSSTATVKGRRSSSPLPCTPEKSVTPASPFGTGNVSKVNIEEVTPTQTRSKENVTNTEKEIQNKAFRAVRETPGHKGNFGTKPMDLQSEDPKGMSLKALEKVVGDKIPNSTKKTEPIMKKIGTSQASGRYLSKPGVELESFKKPSSESGSSPEDDHRQTFVPEDNHNHRPATESRFAEKSSAVGFEKHAQSNSKFDEESNTLEKIDIQQHLPDLFGEKKVSDNSEGQAGSSSDSGSDSDSESDSSDSGSDSGSHSRSRSRSPVGSGSGSSSDSESDASSNSKEGSDEDVDILSDDDKEPQHKLQASEPKFSLSPDQWRSGQNGTDEKQDGDGSDPVDVEGLGSAALDVEGHESDAVDIEKDLADDEKEVELAANDSFVPSKEGNKPVEGDKFIFSDHDAIQEPQTFLGALFDDNENMVRDSFRHEQSDSSERLSKRVPDVKHSDEKSECAKRLKVESLSQAFISEGRDAWLSQSPRNRDVEETYRVPAIQGINRTDRQGNADFAPQKAYNQAFSGKPSSDFQQPGQSSSDKNAQSKASSSDTTRRSKHSGSSGQGRKLSEKGSYVHEGFPIQREKSSRDTQNEDNFVKEKKVPRKPKDGGAGGRHSAPFDSHYRKHGETFGKFKDATQVTNSHMASSPMDGNRVDMEKFPAVSERTLQRELSELESGEFREPLLDEAPVKKIFERKGSFKQSENKPSTSNNHISDLSKVKPVGRAALDSGKLSPPSLGTGFKETPDHHTEDLMRSHHKILPSHSRQLSSIDNTEVGSHLGKLADANSRLRQNEAGAKPGNSIEGYGESHKRAPANGQQLHDSKRGQVSHMKRESKTQTSNMKADLVDGQKDIILTEVNNNARKRRESSSEEDSSSYSKYEKDVPELKGPIKDFLQYEEYVQEYRDKYDSYCSLNKILENYRKDFQKLGNDLEFAKGRDMDRYHKILLQLKESYRHCGARHKQLKKIFIVLHEELKSLKQRIKEYAVSYTKD